MRRETPTCDLARSVDRARNSTKHFPRDDRTRPVGVSRPHGSQGRVREFFSVGSSFLFLFPSRAYVLRVSSVQVSCFAARNTIYDVRKTQTSPRPEVFTPPTMTTTPLRTSPRRRVTPPCYRICSGTAHSIP